MLSTWWKKAVLTCANWWHLVDIQRSCSFVQIHLLHEAVQSSEVKMFVQLLCFYMFLNCTVVLKCTELNRCMGEKSSRRILQVGESAPGCLGVGRSSRRHHTPVRSFRKPSKFVLQFDYSWQLTLFCLVFFFSIYAHSGPAWIRNTRQKDHVKKYCSSIPGRG